MYAIGGYTRGDKTFVLDGRQPYGERESVQKTREFSRCRMPCRAVLIAAPTSNPKAIAYNSDASTLLVTLLHLTEDQWIMLAWDI
jgi:hypothetical protein